MLHLEVSIEDFTSLTNTRCVEIDPVRDHIRSFSAMNVIIVGNAKLKHTEIIVFVPVFCTTDGIVIQLCGILVRNEIHLGDHAWICDVPFLHLEIIVAAIDRIAAEVVVPLASSNVVKLCWVMKADLGAIRVHVLVRLEFAISAVVVGLLSNLSW